MMRTKFQHAYLACAVAIGLCSSASSAQWRAYGLTQSDTVDQQAGDVNHVSYSCSAPGTYCADNTPSPNGFTVTTSTDQTSGKADASSSSSGSYPVNGQATSMSSYAHAVADLPTGAVTAAGTNVGLYSNAQTWAEIGDVVHFTSPESGPFIIGVNLAFSGQADHFAQGGLGFRFVDANGGGLALSANYRPGYDSIASPTSISMSGNWIETSPGRFFGIISIDPNLSDFTLQESASIYGGDGNLAIAFSFVNPAALSYSSQSGLISSDVPEPATWAMMLGGFGMIGLLLRRFEGVGLA